MNADGSLLQQNNFSALPSLWHSLAEGSLCKERSQILTAALSVLPKPHAKALWVMMNQRTWTF